MLISVMKRRISQVFVLTLLLLLGTLPQPVTRKPQPDRVAWVDMERLRALHPDYGQLQSAEDELGRLLAQRDETIFRAEQSIARQNETLLNEASRDSVAELEDYRRSLDSQFSHYSQSLEAQSRSRLLQIKADYDNTVAHLMAGYIEYSRELRAAAERSLAAARLEQEKALEHELLAERARQDGELAAFEDKLARQSQDEKLNLLLQLESPLPEEEENRVRQRLAAIGFELEARCHEKRRQGLVALETLEQRRRDENRRALALHEKRLLGELARTQAPPELRRQLAAAGDQAERAGRREVEAVQGQLKSRRRQMGESLKLRQHELQQALGRLQTALRVGTPERVRLLAQGRLELLEGRLSAARSRHSALLRRMHQEIGKVVAEVAVQRSFACVVSGPQRGLPDLTDYSLAGVKGL